MARVTAAEYAEKYVRRTTGAVQDYTKGIARVTEAPGVKAAANADKMFQKLSQPETQAKYRRNVAAVDLSAWKNAATSKGAPRIAAGVQAAAGKMQNFAGQLLPHIDGIVSGMEGMADLTIEDSIARATHFMREMHGFQYSK